MKDVPVKFRAKGLWGDTYEYGLLTKKKIRSSGEIMFAIAKGNCSLAETVPVKADTIAQLVGYDADGNEIYEGDELYYYRCFCVSGDYIRQNKIPKAGVCTVIDAHCLDGLPYVGLNDHFDYEFLLKAKVDAK